MDGNLHDYLDGDTIFAEVILLRGAAAKSVMLVEGAHDEKVFSNFTDELGCDIVICHGQQNALDALVMLEARGIEGVLCIIDADFSAFLGPPGHKSENLLHTDDHDLEVMLFRSRAFDKVLKEFGSAVKLKRLKDQAIDPREVVWRPAHILGIFRFYSIKKKINLKFEEINFKFIERKSLSVDIDLMIKTVFNNSRKAIAGADKIKAFIEEWSGNGHDHWQMCCGHDIAVVFGKALQGLLGTQPSAMSDGPKIEQQLRLAYSSDQFQNSKLFGGIRNWEQKNAPFRCLPDF